MLTGREACQQVGKSVPVGGQTKTGRVNGWPGVNTDRWKWMEDAALGRLFVMFSCRGATCLRFTMYCHRGVAWYQWPMYVGQACWSWWSQQGELENTVVSSNHFFFFFFCFSRRRWSGPECLKRKHWKTKLFFVVEEIIQHLCNKFVWESISSLTSKRPHFTIYRSTVLRRRIRYGALTTSDFYHVV